MATGLVIIIPVLARPHRVKPLLRNIREVTPEPFRVFWVVDPDDRKEMEALVSSRVHPDDVLVEGGTYARKINLGIAATTEPLIFAGADDLFFEPRWLEEATAKLSEKVHFVGVQDLGHQAVRDGVHATHPLVTREYVEKYGTIDEPGKLYCEEYFHNCVDREACETAQSRGAWAFAHKSVVEHMHTHWGKAPNDATYEKGGAHRKEDIAIYRKRRKLWAPEKPKVEYTPEHQERFKRWWGIWEKGVWEPETKELVESVLSPGDLFVDIGAWIGPVSRWAKNVGAEVVAVEPDPVAIPEFQRVLPDVELWQGAVLTENTTAFLSAKHLGNSVSQIADEGEPVQGWTLSHILAGRKPKLVVMDVEGYEERLLPFVAPLLADLGSVLQVEIHKKVVPKLLWFSGFERTETVGKFLRAFPSSSSSRVVD